MSPELVKKTLFVALAEGGEANSRIPGDRYRDRCNRVSRWGERWDSVLTPTGTSENL